VPGSVGTMFQDLLTGAEKKVIAVFLQEIDVELT
jgi:hypothetical protein